MAFVNIVTSDRGWILEKLATEISSRLPYVQFGRGAQAEADIQYYVTYSCRIRRLSPIEVGYFAHLEPESAGEAHAKFFDVARDVDHCICHARLYEGILREAGIENVSTVSPGVDLETFTPKIRIGVVGRTYHTGRKGEHVVSQVMDIPEIEWSFTGEGWPEPAKHLPAADLPDFYRQLDYVLVPALYEGGPMSVVEALACGTEVIAPKVGWVPEFPHTEFEVGNAEDLRRVLLEIVEKKRALRASVMTRTWDNWADGHDRIFRMLAKRHDLTLDKPPVGAIVSNPTDVGLFMHGSEGKSPGGPSVRVPRLANELKGLGVNARIARHPGTPFSEFEIVHAFNVWAARSALDLIRRAKDAGKSVVFSPIFLDLSQRDFWDGRLPALFRNAETLPALDTALDVFLEDLNRSRAETRKPPEPVPGFYAAVREMLSLSDHVIFLSERERERLERIGATARRSSVVHNPVDSALFSGATGELFEQTYGVKNYVLCVARREPRKNQLTMLHALRDTNVPIVLIGHEASQPYCELIERYRTPNLHVIDRLPPNSPMLASAFAGARVAVLPSWAEGAPLAALEAAASGASMVLSDESGESEYFGPLARYCDPGSPASMREAIMGAYETLRTPEMVEEQKAFIAETYSWPKHVAATQAAYRSAHEGHREADTVAPAAPIAVSDHASIVYDVTTSANHKGRWTGIARVEAALALALKANRRVSVRFVAYNNKTQRFIEIPFDAIRSGRLDTMLAHYDTAEAQTLDLPAGAYLIVPGSAWMQNSNYVEAVVGLANSHGLRLAPIIHDIIPTKFPFWFDDKYAPVFNQNLAILLGNSAAVLAISQATKADVEAFAGRTLELRIPEVVTFREGDEIRFSPHVKKENEASPALIEQMRDRPFVLCVGAIHARKNHQLLYDVWVKLRAGMGGRCPTLVIVGGVAWNGQDVARALRGDARVKDQVLILEGIDDTDLEWLYKNCLFTVYPSLYEGWGLPVAESLRYGKICIASNASSVPEIAPDLVELVDPKDPSRWLAKIQFYAGSPLGRQQLEARIASGYRIREWALAADEVVDLLIENASRPPIRRPYTPGTVIDLANRYDASRSKRKGWYLTERWGAWSGESRATVEVDLPNRMEEAAVLVAEVQALIFAGSYLAIRVGVNGRTIGRWRILQADIQVRHLVIPKEITSAAETLRIEFEITSLTPVSAVKKVVDNRVVGVGMARFAVAPISAVRDASTYLGGSKPNPRVAQLGTQYNFLKDGRGRSFLEGNWTVNSAWGAFNSDVRPRLILMIQEAPGQDVEVEIRLRSVATETQPVTLIALANGVQVGSWTFFDSGVQTLSFGLTAAIRSISEPIAIDLVATDARSPLEVGLGELETAFGIGLVTLRLTVPGEVGPQRAGYELGSSLALQAGAKGEGDATAIVLSGPWHAAEAGATWSFGRTAPFDLQIKGSARPDLLASFNVATFTPPGGAIIPVKALANGETIHEFTLNSRTPREVSFIVPRRFIGRAGELSLTLESAWASSPFAEKDGTDERLLGLRVADVKLNRVAMLGRDDTVLFQSMAAKPDLREMAPLMLGEGWYGQDRTGTWSRGGTASMSFAVASDLGETWRIVTVLRAIKASPDAPARVGVRLNGEKLGQIEIYTAEATLVDISNIVMPAGASAFAQIEFDILDAHRPVDIGLSGDKRQLGVMLQAVVATVGPDGVAAAEASLKALRLRFDRKNVYVPDPAAPPVPVAVQEPAGLDVSPAPPVPEPAPAARPVSAEAAYDFTTFSAGEQMVEGGWSEAETEGTWNLGEGGTIRVPPPETVEPAFEVSVLGRVYGTVHRGPAEVTFSTSGDQVASFTFDTDEFAWRSFTLPRNGPGPVELHIRRLGGFSPKEIGTGDDDRILGFQLRTVRLKPVREDGPTA